MEIKNKLVGTEIKDNSEHLALRIKCFTIWTLNNLVMALNHSAVVSNYNLLLQN